MKNTRVIIVEDDTELGDSLKNWLSSEHEISWYTSAEALLEAIIEYLRAFLLTINCQG